MFQMEMFKKVMIGRKNCVLKFDEIETQAVERNSAESLWPVDLDPFKDALSQVRQGQNVTKFIVNLKEPKSSRIYFEESRQICRGPFWSNRTCLFLQPTHYSSTTTEN